MKPLHIDKKSLFLFFAVLLTGLLAGVFFTWTNAVTPGIGRLDDTAYLQVFQHMNRAILNPPFYIVFMGSLIFTLGSIYLHKSNKKIILILLIAAAVIHFLGVFSVTLFGNLPLNDIVDKTDLSNISLADAKSLRDHYENNWNNLHLIRTISSTTSFVLLTFVCLLRKDNV